MSRRVSSRERKPSGKSNSSPALLLFRSKVDWSEVWCTELLSVIVPLATDGREWGSALSQYGATDDKHAAKSQRATKLRCHVRATATRFRDAADLCCNLAYVRSDWAAACRVLEAPRFPRLKVIKAMIPVRAVTENLGLEHPVVRQPQYHT